MQISGALSGDTPIHHDPDVVELHWMKEPDILMHQNTGVSTPALCGIWMEPDEPLAELIERGEADVRYVDCVPCNLLHGLHTNAMTA